MKLKELNYERYILSTRPTLWLPLYRKGGATFLSSDGYGHLATVNGATWGQQGRKFINTNDNISCGKNISLINVVNDFSLIIWLNPINSTGTRDIANTRDNGNNNGMAIEMAGGSLAPTAYFYVAGFEGTICNTSLIVGDSSCFCITKSSSTVTYYIDGIQKNSFTLSGTVTNSVGNFQIGAWGDKLPSSMNVANALIHDVVKINRALSGLEILNYYLATKWKFV